jgi:hypothetical protein
LADGIASGGISLPQVGSAIDSGSISPPSGAAGRTGTSTASPTPSPLNTSGLGALESGGSSHALTAHTLPISSGTSLQGNSGFTHVGTLNVGDRFVSGSQNSAPTVAARPLEPRPTDSMSVEVPGGPSGNAPAPSSPHSSLGSVEARGSGSLSSIGAGSVEDEEERRRREREQMAQVQRVYYQSATMQAHAVSSTARPPSVDSSFAPVAPARSQRYVLEAHDVNSMGGTPSRLQISDHQSGQVLKTVDLPEGDSRSVVDLPPGQYDFTAVAGERPTGSANPDRLDNFRVDVFQANSPAGGGASPAPAAPSGGSPS